MVDFFASMVSQMIPHVANMGFGLFSEAKQRKKMRTAQLDQMEEMYNQAQQALTGSEALSGLKSTGARTRKSQEYKYRVQEFMNYL
jgi:hypothetical protein